MTSGWSLLPIRLLRSERLHHNLRELLEKEYNRTLSSIRGRAEHALLHIKIFRILSGRYRYLRASHSEKFASAAGIANLAAGF